MRILFFSPLYFPHKGGVEKHAEMVSKVFLKRGLKLSLVTEKYGEKLPEKEIIDGEEVYRIKTGSSFKIFNKFVIWKNLFKHFKLIRNADIVHCHDVFFWYLPFRFLFPKKPVYVTFHGWEGKYPVPKRYVLARKIWEKLSWGNICVGDYLKKWYGTKTDLVTYGGVRKIDQKITPSDVENKKIIFGSRLDTDVGIVEYLEAIRLLKEKNKDLIFDFFGTGSMEKEAGELGTLLGYVGNPISYIIKSRFVYASSYLVVLESLSTKRLSFVVLINKIKKDMFGLSPLKEFIISCRDSKDVFDKTIYYLNHPNEERKLVEKGYQWAREQTWEKVADLYLKLWGIKKKDFSMNSPRRSPFDFAQGHHPRCSIGVKS